MNDPRISSSSTGAGGGGGRTGMAVAHSTGQPPQKDARLLVKDAFSGLTWAMKVLTLDQPADIRRYFIPCAGKSDSPQASTTRSISNSNSSSSGGLGTVTRLSEDRVRRLLCSRVEFSRDAAMKVKINFL
jgi:hypothetical protein